MTLRNGARVRVRPLRSGEEWPIRDLHAHLSARSRYLRFLSPMPALPDALVSLLAEVDGLRRFAIVAERDGDICQTIAIASFAAVDDTTGELGLAVRDSWQRQGLGTGLAAQLLEAADARGFRRFSATIDWQNAAIRRIIDRLGVIVESTLGSGGIWQLAFVRRSAR